MARSRKRERNPKSAYDIDLKKEIREPAPVKQAKSGNYLSWSFTLFDPFPAWHPSKKGSGRGRDKDLFCTVASHLKSYEKRPLEDLYANPDRDHPVELSRLCPEAKRRLEDLKLDDQDRLWSLHFTARWRVWGLLSDDLFCVLWWDPEHRVYPVEKRHT